MLNSDRDEELLQRVADGDDKAFSLLVDRHAATVLALARRMIRNEDDAHDITQETFVRLWKQAGEWQSGRAALSTWLYRVTTNLCLNHIQRWQKRVHSLDKELIESVDPAPPAEELLMKGQRVKAAQAAIDTLPDQQRAAVTLFYTAGLSTAETALALELTVKATESVLVRVRKRILWGGLIVSLAFNGLLAGVLLGSRSLGQPEAVTQAVMGRFLSRIIPEERRPAVRDALRDNRFELAAEFRNLRQLREQVRELASRENVPAEQLEDTLKSLRDSTEHLQMLVHDSVRTALVSSNSGD